MSRRGPSKRLNGIERSRAPVIFDERCWPGCWGMLLSPVGQVGSELGSGRYLRSGRENTRAAVWGLVTVGADGSGSSEGQTAKGATGNVGTCRLGAALAYPGSAVVVCRGMVLAGSQALANRTADQTIERVFAAGVTEEEPAGDCAAPGTHARAKPGAFAPRVSARR